MTISLDVTKREVRGKALKQLRADGKVPGVMYGPKEKPVNITVEAIPFKKILEEAGESSVIVLKGLDSDTEVLVHDVAFDPVKGTVAHVDFYAIEANKVLTTNVPLTFVGEVPAAKVGGNLSKALFEIEVTCLPKDLPREVEVDVTVLEEIGQTIHIRDLTIPSGVTVENEEEEVVASVIEVVEEEEEAVAEVDMDAIEVEQKGKEEGADATEEEQE